MTMTMQMTDDECWQAATARDRSFDGRFITGVLTTGIYCRPSCPARHPHRANVRFFASPAEARAAGLRACLRCSPDDVSREERAVLPPSRRSRRRSSRSRSPRWRRRPAIRWRISSGCSAAIPAFARRLCPGSAGGTRSGGAQRGRHGSPMRSMMPVTMRPRGSMPSKEGRMGMAPSAWANGGKGATIHWASVETSLGTMLVAATAKGVCRLSFHEGREALEARFPRAELVEGGAEFAQLLDTVIAAVEAPGDFATSRSTSKARPFRKRSGANCNASPRAKPAPMPSSPPPLASPRRCARRAAPTAPTMSPS